MRTTGAAVALVVGGRLAGPDVELDGLSIDSRSVGPGQLFVPVVAGRDGHDFIDAALAAGAAAYLTVRPPGAGTAVVVDDTAAALSLIGAWARDRLPDRVVGVTGSVGKTSTKDLLAPVLARRWPTAASHRSFNNELGVPLTLGNAPDGTEAVVVEMGARGRGQVAALCAVARPTVGIVTAVGACHTEQFGSLEAVAESKSELVACLPTSGTAVLNAADPRVAAMADRTDALVLTFGTPTADVHAHDVRLDDELRPAFGLCSPWGDVEVRLSVRGEHQVSNALAAAAAALACGVQPDDVAAGLSAATLSPWRMELARSRSGAIVLNDAYNANPLSTASALHTLARLDARRRIAVLGVMAELGAFAEAEHHRIGELARSLGIEVVGVATRDYGGDVVAGPEAALERLGPLVAGDAVLVKGSRAAGLENLAASLLAL